MTTFVCKRYAKLIPDEAVYRDKDGLIELKCGDAKKILNLKNKYPNLFNEKMTYKEMFNYLKDDFVPLCKLQAQIAKVKHHNKITIYDYEFTPETFLEFEKYIINYDKSEECRDKFNEIVDTIYSKYKIMVDKKNKK